PAREQARANEAAPSGRAAIHLSYPVWAHVRPGAARRSRQLVPDRAKVDKYRVRSWSLMTVLRASRFQLTRGMDSLWREPSPTPRRDRRCRRRIAPRRLRVRSRSRKESIPELDGPG